MIVSVGDRQTFQGQPDLKFELFTIMVQKRRTKIGKDSTIPLSVLHI